MNEVRIWGKMLLTKTAGQARLTQAEANTSDDDPNDSLDWKIVNAYHMST